MYANLDLLYAYGSPGETVREMRTALLVSIEELARKNEGQKQIETIERLALLGQFLESICLTDSSSEETAASKVVMRSSIESG